jgi:hypothetical protein
MRPGREGPRCCRWGTLHRRAGDDGAQLHYSIIIRYKNDFWPSPQRPTSVIRAGAQVADFAAGAGRVPKAQRRAGRVVRALGDGGGRTGADAAQARVAGRCQTHRTLAQVLGTPGAKCWVHWGPSAGYTGGQVLGTLGAKCWVHRGPSAGYTGGQVLGTPGAKCWVHRGPSAAHGSGAHAGSQLPSARAGRANYGLRAPGEEGAGQRRRQERKEPKGRLLDSLAAE